MKTRLLINCLSLLFLINYASAQVYVNKNATGNNDGTSWADAYTELYVAANAATTATDIWVAANTYTPDPSLRTNSITLRNNVKIYGGFNGTETMLSERDSKTNITIISGDLNDDDPVNLVFGDPLRNDNSYRLLQLGGSAETVYIEGFTLTGANANGTGSGQDTAGLIDLKNFNLDFKMIDCIVTKNTMNGLGLIRDFDANHSSTIYVGKTEFSENIARGAIIFYGRANFGRNVKTRFESCLFTRNNAINTNGSNGLSGLTWMRQDINTATQDIIINNCTITENDFVGSNPIIQAGRSSFATLNMRVSNSIFWRNFNNSSETRAVGNSASFTPPSSFIVRNSLSPLGFSNVSNKQNVITTSPTFTDANTNDFTVLPNSPIIDAGDNTLIIDNTLTDIGGDTRIQNSIVDLGAYEVTPDPCDPFGFAFTSVTKNSINLTWQANPIATSWDVTYHLASQPFSTAQTVNGFTTTSATINNLLQDTQYTFYVRGVCSGTPSAFKLAGTIATLKSEIYVASDAAGANNGTSWADAYTDLSNALTLNPLSIFWVKSGTYIPATTRDASFTISEEQKVYGGFNGTETNLNQRNAAANTTILSGDIAGNDATVFSATDPLRNENAYRLIEVSGANVIIDGFTIQDANANGAAISDQEGSAINITSGTAIDIVNCKFMRNTATRAGTITCIDLFAAVDINIKRSIFTDNVAASAPIYYGRAELSRVYNINVESSLIYNNESTNTAQGQDGGMFWLRQDKNGIQNISFTNSTITDNIIGTNTQVVTTLLNSGGSISTSMYNTIVWNNVNTSGANMNAIETAGTVIIRNSLSNNNFPGHTNKQNTIATDPLFTDVNVQDYTLQFTSPAIDQGDSQFVTDQLDLAGNTRISGSSVDIGTYEKDANQVVVPFVDPNFKAALVSQLAINLNGDSEIQVQEAQVYNGAINTPSASITSLGGIEFFTEITSVDASDNALLNVDLSANNLVTAINLADNQLTVVDFTANIMLTDLNLANNTFTIINVSNYTLLEGLDLSGNQLNQLTLFNNMALTSIDVSNNMLTSLTIKNGNNTAITSFDATMNSALNCIEVDDVTFANANFTNIDSQTSFSNDCFTQVFVNVNATGANDGSSWADGYTGLTAALANNPAAEFWIAAGRYVAPSGARSVTFTFTNDQKIYGGFDGNETIRTDRDPKTNITIIDGDRDNDDGTVLLDHNSSNSSLGTDNVYHVITVTGNNVIIDGVTIKGGNANGGTGEDRRGSAIDIKEDARTLTVNDVRFNYNRVFDGGIIFGSQQTATALPSNYTFTNCVFDRNLGRFATIYYFPNPLSTTGVNSTFINCLIYDVRTTSVSVYPNSTTGAPSTRSLFWLRSDLAGGINNGKFINLTVTQSVFNTGTSPTAGLISGTRLNGTTNIEVYNSIFWNNQSNNVAIDTQGTSAPANTVIVRNSLSQDNFANQTDKMNVINSNPNFTNEAVNDFTQQSNSPTIDAGDNQYVPANILGDLIGNNRIFNTTVDMGAYEFGAMALGTNDFDTNIKEILIYPNPVTSILNIKMQEEVERYAVYSITGKQLLIGHSKTIDVSKLVKGIYIIKITSTENTEAVKRFIKQ